ncbi:MAG: NusG domain II-containing protein [Oscillospiraceae bacterium]|nr:NusG domain II-containing protein [Oscillospiraceae bacterium]
MKSKYWAIGLAALLIMCLGLSFLVSGGEPAARAEITSEGRVVQTVDLSIDQELTIPYSGGGVNVVTVKDGKIAVTYADCPDGYCVDRGYCNSGTQIVCLPHRLVIRFLGKQEIDGIVG